MHMFAEWLPMSAAFACLPADRNRIPILRGTAAAPRHRVAACDLLCPLAGLGMDALDHHHMRGAGKASRDDITPERRPPAGSATPPSRMSPSELAWSGTSSLSERVACRRERVVAACPIPILAEAWSCVGQGVRAWMIRLGKRLTRTLPCWKPDFGRIETTCGNAFLLCHTIQDRRRSSFLSNRRGTVEGPRN